MNHLYSSFFSCYFSLANNRTFLQRDTNRIRIWFPFFSHFEENVKTAIPNEYCFPSCLSDARTVLNNWIDPVRYSFFWIILFLFMIVTYSLTFTKQASFASIWKR